MKVILWKLYSATKSVFPTDRPDSQKKRLDASHKKSEFDTCPDGSADANHREHLFIRMSVYKSEDYGRRRFSLQPFGC